MLPQGSAYGAVALNFTGGDVAERVSANRVTATYFRTFRVPVARGRAFTSDEDRPGAPGAVIVSHDFWTRRLGGDAEVVGRTLSFGSVPYTVVGVVAPDFSGNSAA